MAPKTMSIEGDWTAEKVHCACGYHAVWKVSYGGTGDSEITVTEQPGAACCEHVRTMND